MKFRTDFEKNQKVYYVDYNKRKVTAVIVEVNGNGYSPHERYTIKITANTHPVWFKGDRFTTSGNYLRKR